MIIAGPQNYKRLRLQYQREGKEANLVKVSSQIRKLKNQYGLIIKIGDNCYKLGFFQNRAEASKAAVTAIELLEAGCFDEFERMVK